MHRTDGAGHLNHMFVAEDSLLNRAPTEITADFLNALQEELSGVIEWAGMNLNKADNHQLLQALQAKFASIDPGGDYASKSAVQTDGYKISDAAGTANAIQAAFFPVVATLSHGMTLFVRASAANTDTIPTFTPHDGIIAALPIVKGNDLALSAGDIAGSGYWLELRYDNALGKWVLLNPATGLLPIVVHVPVGTVMHVATVAAPAGFLKANGAAVSRTTYAALFTAIGTSFGVGDGASTFNLPDLRGEFIRGWDDGRLVDSGRTFGSDQKGTLVGYDKAGDAVFCASTNTSVPADSQLAVGVDNYATADYPGMTIQGVAAATQVNLPGTPGATGGYTGVVRPRNVALLPVIKY